MKVLTFYFVLNKYKYNQYNRPLCGNCNFYGDIVSQVWLRNTLSDPSHFLKSWFESKQILTWFFAYESAILKVLLEVKFEESEVWNCNNFLYVHVWSISWKLQYRKKESIAWHDDISYNWIVIWTMIINGDR